MTSDQIQNKYLDVDQERCRTRGEIRQIVTETWNEAIDRDESEHLMDSMTRRLGRSTILTLDILVTKSSTKF